MQQRAAGLAPTDYSTKTYSALKIYAHNLIAEDELDNETAIYEHISNSGHSDHPGKAFVRIIQDSFVCKSRAGNLHKCLVHEVLSNDILTLRYHSRDRHLPEATLKQFLMHLLIAVDYLHRVCQVIHTGLFWSATFIANNTSDDNQTLRRRTSSSAWLILPS